MRRPEGENQSADRSLVDVTSLLNRHHGELDCFTICVWAFGSETIKKKMSLQEGQEVMSALPGNSSSSLAAFQCL